MRRTICISRRSFSVSPVFGIGSTRPGKRRQNSIATALSPRHFRQQIHNAAGRHWSARGQLRHACILAHLRGGLRTSESFMPSPIRLTIEVDAAMQTFTGLEALANSIAGELSGKFLEQRPGSAGGIVSGITAHFNTLFNVVSGGSGMASPLSRQAFIRSSTSVA